MPKIQGQKGWLAKGWHVFRWPFALTLLVVGVVFFLVGLVENTGYMGTSSAQLVKAGDQIWKDFNDNIGDDKLFSFLPSDSTPKIDTQNVVNFDQRLIDSLTYLTKKKDSNCGTDKGHEHLGLSVVSSDLSDLTYPAENPAPPSTIARGVGVRIVGADKIKCTKISNNGTPPTVFDRIDIPFDNSKPVKPDQTKLADPTIAQVLCAVDYFPVQPTGTAGVDASESVPTVDNAAYAELNPKVFDYQDLAVFAQKAAVYKIAQISFELLHIDDAGCYSANLQTGSARLIPNALILPEWTEGKLSGVRKNLNDAAIKEIPYSYQKTSPVTGFTFDVKLNSIGLHFNY